MRVHNDGPLPRFNAHSVTTRRAFREVAPLPSWCVDILLSPDLQTQRAPTPAAAAPRPQGMRVAAQAAEDDGKGKGKKRGGGRGGRKRSG